MKRFEQIFSALIIAVSVSSCTETEQKILPEELAINQKFNPETYVCYQPVNEIFIDGKLDEADWQKAEWSNLFVDIEGDKKPIPTYETRAKMLWDQNYLYVAAELKEPHIWGTLHQRDTVIFYDNDFEVFIDPDWDTHNYYEFEINTLNTVWDLLLTKPYRDNGLAIDSWDILGLKSATSIDGTMNNPADTDKAWYVEIAFPMEVLREAKAGQKVPVDGEQWRIGFSRVEWQMIVENGRYLKKKGPNGERIPEDNWVWSATDEIAMHKPELWGVVQFAKSTTEDQNTVYKQNDDWEIISQLRNLYYRQIQYKNKFGEFATSAKALRFDEFTPTILVLGDTYITSILSTSGKSKWYIREDGKLWQE